MGSKRGQRGSSRHQGGQGTRSLAGKPPLVTGSWQPTVPSWEKKFCKIVGSVPWHRLLEAKKYLHIHDKIVKWNDSAVEEAFHNAKTRYWEEINGLPCSISLPDPNMHIDEVDWESKMDPDLLLDLEQGPEAFCGSNSGQTIIFGDALANPSFAFDGWGDVGEEWPKDETSWKVIDDCVGGENVYGADPAERVTADAGAVSELKQGHFQGWNQQVGRSENNKDRTVGNWDTWDWDKMNRELEPAWCENTHGVDSADRVAADCDPFWGSKQDCSQGRTQKVSAQEDCDGKDYGKLVRGHDATGNNWDTWDWDNMDREHTHIGCGKTYGSNPVERIAAGSDLFWVSEQTHSQQWNKLVSTQENMQYMTSDNWDTWDWEKMNRELEPDIPSHKHAGFGRNDKQMRYGWNHGKGMKQNNFVY